MTCPRCYWYADERTRRALARPEGAVLLYGGYGGNSNFGDILQVKSTVQWHRRHTGREPLLVLQTGPIADEGHADRVRQWLGVEGVVFYDWERRDLDALGLGELTEPPAVPRLHVYGGGILNEYWGTWVLAAIEALLGAFRVRHYVMTGQEVAPDFRDALAAHFRQYPPVIAAGRDAQSAEVIAGCGVEAGFSFDDATELLLDLTGAVRGGRPAPARDALLHLNLSFYTCNGDTSGARRELVRVLSLLKARLRAGGHDPDVALLLAYEDRRPDMLDTMEVVQNLEHDFPFSHYCVVSLARLALEFHDGGFPCAPARLAAPLAVASSYHTALFCALLGVPCYLQARNSYYRQKRDGLGLPAVGFEDFLADPRTPDLAPRLEARRRWLERLRKAMDREGLIRPADRVSPEPAAPVRMPWVAKPGMESAASRLRELQGRIRELERANADLRERLDGTDGGARVALPGLGERRGFLRRVGRRLRLLRRD